MVGDRCTLLTVRCIECAVAIVIRLRIRDTLLAITFITSFAFAPAIGSNEDRLTLSADITVTLCAASAAVAVKTLFTPRADHAIRLQITVAKTTAARQWRAFTAEAMNPRASAGG